MSVVNQTNQKRKAADQRKAGLPSNLLQDYMGPKKIPTAEEVEDIKKSLEDKRIAYLESRVANLEQYSIMNDGGELDVSSTEQQVAAFLLSKGILLDCNNIEACLLLPRRNASIKQTIIMRFAKRKHKTTLLKQRNKLKGTKVYINEHLTKQNENIARRAHFLKKQRKIQTT